MDGGKAMTMKAENGGGGRRGIPWRLIGWGGAAFLLLLPLVANAPWTASDFIFAGVMFGAVGLGLELAARKRDLAYTLGAAAALAVGLLSFWITGAVGVIGNEQDDPNLLYLAVVALGLLGAAVARFRPAGMARAMAVAALAEALVPAVAWFAWPEARAAIWSPEVPAITVVFTGMWLASAWLFRKAEARASAGAAL